MEEIFINCTKVGGNHAARIKQQWPELRVREVSWVFLVERQKRRSGAGGCGEHGVQMWLTHTRRHDGQTCRGRVADEVHRIGQKGSQDPR